MQIIVNNPTSVRSRVDIKESNSIEEASAVGSGKLIKKSKNGSGLA
jgi:hypothetical protein